MKYALCLLLFYGCSGLQNSQNRGVEIPRWVYSPYEYCDEAIELCATGDSDSYSAADAQARKNLASIFEVKVKSEFNSQGNAQEDSPLNGVVKQSVQHSLQESVEEILEVVQIKNHFENEGLFFSLASLDRTKAGELIGGRLTRLDNELVSLWSARSRTKLRKIIKTYIEREKLNERYSIVTGSPRPSEITYKDILDWKESRTKSEVLALRIGQAPEWLTDKLKELLTEAGFKLVKGDASKALLLNMESIHEYLNVEGFEKYTFTLNMTSIEKGEKKQVISASETVVGRNQTDALLKAKFFFLDYIEQHLSDLKLD